MSGRSRSLLVGAIAGAVGFAALVGSPPMLLAVAVVAVGWPWFRRRRRAALRERALAAEVLHLAVLLELTLAGGVSIRRALEDVVPWLSGELHTALVALLGRVARGASLADELDALAAGEFERLRGLATVVGATQRYGAPARAGLLSVLDDLRLEHRHDLERRARQIPVRLLFPLVGGVLPAFVLLSVVPMLAGAVAQLRAVSP